jgi:hypothetical protein
MLGVRQVWLLGRPYLSCHLPLLLHLHQCLQVVGRHQDGHDQKLAKQTQDVGVHNCMRKFLATMYSAQQWDV